MDYFDKGQGPRSVCGAKLSDGSTWYRVNVYSLALNRDADLWFKYESNKMTVTDIPKSYTVYLNANGGNVSTGYKIVTDGEAFGTLLTPTRDGYIFDGWYTSASGGTQVTSSTIVDSSYGGVTLYAHWSVVETPSLSIVKSEKGLWDVDVPANYRVDYYPTATSTEIVDYSPASDRGFRNLGYKEKVLLSDGTTRLGGGSHWFTVTNEMRLLDCNSTYYTIDLELNGGSEGPGSIEVNASSTYGPLSIPLHKNPSATFDGWYTSERGGTKVTSSTRLIKNADHTLYAHWVIKGQSEDDDYSPTDTSHTTSNSTPCSNGHIWNNGQITTDATATTAGVRTYTCTICKATRTEMIHALGSGTLENFSSDKAYYYNGFFRDVAADAWYADNVSVIYQLGLMKGTGANTFAPENNVTIAETVTLAARLHSIYYTGKDDFEAYDGGNWYDPYVNYARENGIISENYNYALPTSREVFAHILAKALPESELASIRNESIQFADAGTIVYAGDVKLLCKAGVINGVQSDGMTKFLPNNTITRAEGAAIVTRMVKPELRK